MRISFRRGRETLERFKEKYGLLTLDEIKINRLSTFKRRIVRDVNQNVVGWIMEIRASRRSGRAETVVIEGMDGRALKVHPSNIIVIGNKLFLVESSSSTDTLERLVKYLNIDSHTTPDEIKRKVSKINPLLLKSYAQRMDENVNMELKIKEPRRVDTLKLIEMVEERTREELDDILMKWFLGEIHLDDFLDAIERLNTILERLSSIKRALVGDTIPSTEDLA
ncbi:MAG: hypothetical protein DRJ49_01290 [Thermoprotei archaeon]|nr:MAG: hypothetical protein DRN53_07010 [Thermoprotei archaeon]RLE89989.1 MAG: hypothetical protein DRJ49_01290 [Thermoprotei archaeon]